MVFIAAAIRIIEEPITGADQAANRKICIHTLHSQIELWNFWKMGNIKSSDPGSPLPISHRTKPVLVKPIVIKRCPVTQPWKPVAEVKAGPAVPRLCWFPRRGVPSAENAFEIGVRCKWHDLSSEERCKRKAELNVWGRLK